MILGKLANEHSTGSHEWNNNNQKRLQLKTPTKQESNDKPWWWLTEESLLGEIELDYSADDKVNCKEVQINEEVKPATPKPTPARTIQQNGLIAKKELLANWGRHSTGWVVNRSRDWASGQYCRDTTS